MIRYRIHVYTIENNKEKVKNYNCRHFTVNNNSLVLYPVDFNETIHILLNPAMMFEVYPYIIRLETD